MSHNTRRVGGALAAAFLASILAAAMVVPSLALTITNAKCNVTVPTGIPTAVGISYARSSTAPGDTLAVGTTFAVNIPAGYAWTAAPTLSSTPVGAITLSGPVPTNDGLTQTWTLTTFPASGSWTLTLAGGTISTTNTTGTAHVTLTVGATAPVQVARLTASGAAAGSLVPVLISPTVVPADGISTTRIVFGVVGATSGTYISFTVSTTAGTFVGDDPAPGDRYSGRRQHRGDGAVRKLVEAVNIAQDADPASPDDRRPRDGLRQVLAPLAGGSFTDSSTKVTFAGPAGAGGGHGDNDKDHGSGHGARKTGFYAAGLTTAACATAGAVPAAGAKSFGFAVLNSTGHGKLNATVALKGAVPNATFTVSVNPEWHLLSVVHDPHQRFRQRGGPPASCPRPGREELLGDGHERLGRLRHQGGDGTDQAQGSRPRQQSRQRQGQEQRQGQRQPRALAPA